MQIEYQEIDQEQTPLGTLTLSRYRAETGEVGYQIELDGSFLMATHGSHSERTMAGLALQRLHRPPTCLRILVGGLGAGHTLRAALDLPGVEEVVVVEIGAKVVEWNRRYFAAVNGNAVNDPRVTVKIGDLAEELEADAAYDLLLLDVDNGPGWLAAPANAGLYSMTGVQRCRAALRNGGVLAIWCPQHNPALATVLDQVFACTEEVETTTEARTAAEPASVISLAW